MDAIGRAQGDGLMLPLGALARWGPRGRESKPLGAALILSFSHDRRLYPAQSIAHISQNCGGDVPGTEVPTSTAGHELKRRDEMAVKPVPEGYHTATPYLILKDAARAIEFYKKAFGATELMRIADPGGRIAHAEIKIGDSPIMLADELPEMGRRGPQSLGGTPVGIMLYVEDVDARFKQAIGAGATETMAVQDQFYGDRSGGLTDPFGHTWWIATHKEDVSPEEMRKRAEASREEYEKA
jgi:PhnB protein